MENASKALIIAGAILLSILIIAIGIFIFNGANSTITGSMTSMSTQEIEAFNNQFISYGGEQSGSNVKKLVERLIANSSTYKDEPKKMPTAVFKAQDGSLFKARMHQPNKEVLDNNWSLDGNGTTYGYIPRLTTIRDRIEAKHMYWVNINYGTSGIVDWIEIRYTK